MTEYLTISEVAAFVYCEKDWFLYKKLDIPFDDTNLVKGKIFHENVHQDKIKKSKNKIEITGLNLFNDDLMVFGKSDIVELIVDVNGKYFKDFKDKYLIYPVEYKVGNSQRRDSNYVQLCLQAMCLEYMFDIKIEFGYIYYKRDNKKLKIIFDDDLRTLTLTTIERMRNIKSIDECNANISGCTGCRYNDYCNILKN